MTKYIIIGAAGLIAGFIAAYTISWGDSEDKIRQLEKDLADYKNKYSLIRTTADSLDNVASSLQTQGETYLRHIDSLKGEIQTMETEREEEIIKVAATDQPHDLIAKLENEFPAFRNKPMGTIKMRNAKTGKEVTSFYLPVQFITSFIQDRIDVKSFKLQKEAWETIGLNYESYTALQDSVITLKEKKAQAYLEGMNYGINKYDTLVKDYIGTLKNPPKVEFPKLGSIALGAAIGLLTGILTGGIIAN